MIKAVRFLFISILFFSISSFSQAQNPKRDILNKTFKSTKECYFSFPIKSKEQLNQLSKIISIDRVTASTAYAYANRNDFNKFLNTNIDFQLLDHPNANFKAVMFDSKLKQSYAWDKYLSYNDYVDMMYQFATDYPDICQVFSLGQSVDGRELLIAKISDNISLSEAEPQFLYTGQMHGDEVATSIILLRLIDYLLTNYGANDQINRLIDEVEIWINPLANPDGTYTNDNSTVSGATRFNANAIDINRNFPDPKDGDHPDGKSWQAETQIFMTLAETQHFVMSANTHSGSEVVNYPWDTWTKLHADDNWWQMVSHEYADLAQLNSPSGYMSGFDDGITNGAEWYIINGGRQDYMNYFHHCREFTIEQSTEKMVPENELPNYWDYNRQAMLNYMEQVTYGFRGRITDSDTGDPIQAKLEIESHDFDNSFIFSNLEGYYYRPIKAGTYTLNFSAEGYESKSISNQSIADFDSKIINVGLKKINTGVDSNILSELRIVNPVQNHQLQISSPIDIIRVNIYSILGQLIYTNKTKNKELQIDIQNFKSGIYILNLEFSDGERVEKRFIMH
ncbi:MAG: hypothetical protein DRI74_03230 [Bacteroidetes bacterium]|nr:MAG: hypothetical protein DRI74_03230 [Bacteroidota bacterium]